MIELTAPFFSPMTTTLVRNPQGESINVDVRMQHRRSMTGRNYSYVNKSDRHKLELTFIDISRDKIREVEEFVRSYTGETIKYVDPEGSVWRVVLETNPADFAITKYAAPCGVGRKESGEFTLTLVGTRISLAVFDQCPPLLEPEVLAEAQFEVAAFGEVSKLVAAAAEFGVAAAGEVVQPAAAAVEFGAAAAGEVVHPIVAAVEFGAAAAGEVEPGAVVAVEFGVAAAGVLAANFRDFAVDFPGGLTGRHLDATGNNPPAPTSSKVISWAGWINPDTTSGRKTVSRYWDPAQIGWLLELNGAQLRFLTQTGGGGAVLVQTVGTPASAGNWTFAGFTWDGVDFIFYYGPKGGSISSESFAEAGTVSYSGSSLYALGGNGHASVDNMNGRQAESAYFDSTLSAGDMDTLFNSGDGVAYSNLSGAFKTATALVAYHGLQDADEPTLDEHSTYDLVEDAGAGVLTYQASGPGV